MSSEHVIPPGSEMCKELLEQFAERTRERDFARMHDSYIRSLTEKSYDDC